MPFVFDSPLPQTGYLVIDCIIYYIHLIFLFMVNGPLYVLPYFLLFCLCGWLFTLGYYIKRRYMDGDETYRREKAFDSIVFYMLLILCGHIKKTYDEAYIVHR